VLPAQQTWPGKPQGLQVVLARSQTNPVAHMFPWQHDCPAVPQAAQPWFLQIWAPEQVAQAAPPLPQAESEVPLWH
jgi:hypothetical protein